MAWAAVGWKWKFSRTKCKGTRLRAGPRSGLGYEGYPRDAGGAAPVRSIQEVGPVLCHHVEEVAYVAVEQQHADRDRGHAIRPLAIGADADPPPRAGERRLGPAQLQIDDVGVIEVDGADGRDLLPGDAPRHQPQVEDAEMVDREHDRASCRAPAQAVHEG